MKWLGIAVAIVICQTGLSSMDKRNDSEVIEALKSRDASTADRAAQEVFVRGDRMFPLLMTLEGDKQAFSGTALYNPRASIVYPIPGHGQLTESQTEQVTTLEVAALYLISAIYHENLHFANGLLLVDLTVQRGDRKARNSKEYLGRAWESLRDWMLEYQRRGIGFMRSKKQDPLSAAKLGWY
jgi:hypothetical protein